jgi:hypothetical protein
MTLLLLFVLFVLAIDNITDIVSTVELLKPMREKFKAKFPGFAKLAECRYCQSFWLSGLVSAVCPLAFPIMSKLFGDSIVIWVTAWVVSWFAIHRAAQFTREFMDRYLNRAPMSLFIQTAQESAPPEQQSEPLPWKWHLTAWSDSDGNWTFSLLPVTTGMPVDHVYTPDEVAASMFQGLEELKNRLGSIGSRASIEWWNDPPADIIEVVNPMLVAMGFEVRQPTGDRALGS